MITANQLYAGIGEYMQAKLMPRLDSKRQFALGTVYALCAPRLNAIADAAAQSPAARALGIVHEDGSIDIDALYSAALTQMQAQHKLSIDIPLMGAFAFDESDLRDLRECIARKEAL